MSLTSNNQLWADILCCPKCKNVFSTKHLPLTLKCSHLVCVECTKSQKKSSIFCPIDKSEIKLGPLSKLYINGPVLSIVLGGKNSGRRIDGTMKSFKEDSTQYSTLSRLEDLLHELSHFFYKVDSERGATVSSNRISRTIQRKLLNLLFANLWYPEGRTQAIQILRSMSERIIAELMLCIQSSSNLSSSLWTAVRARGCQFLGPAMQEDVLKLILNTFKNGDSIARKTLVLYVVETLALDYPHISKTCVGHVVQLLYRASCFNVIKREGESSLMQLKEQYRNLEALRTEHDAQIVQIALEASLRITPDQWSSLLYGDQNHRAYMQSICDRIGDCSLQNALDELRRLAEKQPADRELFGLKNVYRDFEALVEAKLDSSKAEDFGWENAEAAIRHLKEILGVYSKFIESRNSEREQRNMSNRIGFGYAQRGERDSHNVASEYYRPFSGRNNHANYCPRDCTPLRSIGSVLPPQPLLDSGSTPVPVCYPPLLSSNMANFFDPPFSVGSPPSGFSQLPLGLSPTQYSSPRRDSFATPLNAPTQQLFDLIPNALIPLYPANFVSTLVEPVAAATTHSGTFANNSSGSPTICSNSSSVSGSATLIPMLPTTFMPFVQPVNVATTSASPVLQTSPLGTLVPVSSQSSIFSTSPPNYQLNLSSNLVTPIPVPQSVVYFGTTPPFGSPPLLISDFTNWTTPMDSQGCIINGGGMFGIGAENDGEGYGENANNEIRGHALEDDDGDCHVSLTVANACLHEEKNVNSFGRSFTLPSPLQTSRPSSIPSPASGVTYTVAGGDSAQTNLCTVIRGVNHATTPTKFIPHVAAIEDLKAKTDNLSVS